jgi:hypothetical protein
MPYLKTCYLTVQRDDLLSCGLKAMDHVLRCLLDRLYITLVHEEVQVLHQQGPQWARVGFPVPPAISV